MAAAKRNKQKGESSQRATRRETGGQGSGQQPRGRNDRGRQEPQDDTPPPFYSTDPRTILTSEHIYDQGEFDGHEEYYTVSGQASPQPHPEQPPRGGNPDFSTSEPPLFPFYTDEPTSNNELPALDSQRTYHPDVSRAAYPSNEFLTSGNNAGAESFQETGDFTQQTSGQGQQLEDDRPYDQDNDVGQEGSAYPYDNGAGGDASTSYQPHHTDASEGQEDTNSLGYNTVEADSSNQAGPDYAEDSGVYLQLRHKDHSYLTVDTSWDPVARSLLVDSSVVVRKLGFSTRHMTSLSRVSQIGTSRGMANAGSSINLSWKKVDGYGRVWNTGNETFYIVDGLLDSEVYVPEAF
ncbi:hypothetical protein B0T25DRAFT_13654 [Lasiosphaeria hispida]|uniref:Uncharacterized protein n=1 Tax=Lasiosphaeria hispida TaxID=260671 RepID=A0AAJ0MJI4_9PEZI|nr:hypothetical protein B0T25DRAFT_13654 [Lasiosphaeria hispida]